MKKILNQMKEYAVHVNLMNVMLIIMIMIQINQIQNQDYVEEEEMMMIKKEEEKEMMIVKSVILLEVKNQMMMIIIIIITQLIVNLIIIQIPQLFLLQLFHMNHMLMLKFQCLMKKVMVGGLMIILV